MRRFLCVLLLCAVTCAGAPQNATPDPCDKEVTFCWYGPYKDGSDEVKVWGHHWIPNDQSKPIDFRTAFRCVKRLHICMKAEDVILSGTTTILRIQLLPVTKWAAEQITADGEAPQMEPCSRESYIINRGDKTTLMIASPGPQAETPNCIAALGKPKTTIYRLTQ
jgi:hypothetical protein